MKKLGLLLMFTLCGCLDEAPEPQPVTCLNTETFDHIEGLRVKPYGLGDKTYIKYTGRNGLEARLTAENSANWICRDLDNA